MKKLIMGTLVAFLVALSGTLSAHAATYGFPVGATGGGAMGLWDVQFTSSNNDTIWNVVINRNAGSIPNADVDTVILNFYNPGGLTRDPVSSSSNGGTNVNWAQTPSVGTANFIRWVDSTPGAIALQAGGTNSFNGTVNLQNPFKQGFFRVSLQSDSGEQWSSDYSFTPEMPGSVLGMTAMLPMIGGVLLRRRSLRSKTA